MLIIYGHWCFVCSGYIGLWLKGSWICWSVGEEVLVDIVLLILKRLKERRSPLEFKLLLFCSINDWMAALSSHSFSNMLGISVLLDDFISNSCTLIMSLG